MSAKKRGLDYERRVVVKYKENGWDAHRSAASNGTFDVVAIHPKLKEIRLIQCKYGKSYTLSSKRRLETSLAYLFDGHYHVKVEIV